MLLAGAILLAFECRTHGDAQLIDGAHHVPLKLDAHPRGQLENPRPRGIREIVHVAPIGGGFLPNGMLVEKLPQQGMFPHSGRADREQMIAGPADPDAKAQRLHGPVLADNRALESSGLGGGLERNVRRAARTFERTRRQFFCGTHSTAVDACRVPHLPRRISTLWHDDRNAMDTVTHESNHPPQPPHPVERLAELGREYHRVRDDHDRESPRGATRRRLRQDMQRITERFERLLTHWVSDQKLRDEWQAYLYHGADQPQEPRMSVPPLFRGQSEAGALVEILAAPDGGYDIFVDGSRALHHEIPWHLEPEHIDPVQIREWTCHETFAAPDEAVAALETFLAQPGTDPPWAWAPALFEDGLIDLDFCLTPRGARRLGAQAPEIREGGKRANFCVVLASRARARVLTLASSTSEGQPTLAALQEAADTSNPQERARDSEQFSDTRPGLRREGGHAPRHAVSDRRQSHRRDDVLQFFQVVVDEAAQIWRAFDTCKIVIVASPPMLGLLRGVMAHRMNGPSPYDLVEFPRDLTHLGAPAVHDALARAGLLPPRGRRPPLKPMRTPNPWQ